MAKGFVEGTKNMKFITKSAAAAVVALAAFGSSAAYAADATATATATLVEPVTLSKTADLNFGTVVSGTGASTVQVSNAGARTCGAGITCAGTVTAAQFSVDGANGYVLVISVPTSAVSLTSGANSMTANLTPVSNITLGTGASTFGVGGTLNVGANQAQGVYTGTFTVSANYQ